jgi:hypothetical protein
MKKDTKIAMMFVLHLFVKYDWNDMTECTAEMYKFCRH